MLYLHSSTILIAVNVIYVHIPKLAITKSNWNSAEETELKQNEMKQNEKKISFHNDPNVKIQQIIYLWKSILPGKNMCGIALSPR